MDHPNQSEPRSETCWLTQEGASGFETHIFFGTPTAGHFSGLSGKLSIASVPLFQSRNRYYMIIFPKLTLVAPVHLFNRPGAGKIQNGRTKIAILGLIMAPPQVKKKLFYKSSRFVLVEDRKVLSKFQMYLYVALLIPFFSNPIPKPSRKACHLGPINIPLEHSMYLDPMPPLAEFLPV